MFWSIAAGFAILSLVVWGAAKLASGAKPAGSPSPQAAIASAEGDKQTPPPPGADTKTKLRAAQQYMDRKDYAVAEGIYRQVVAAEPSNADALKGLASVLYREDKVDESADILDRIPKN